MATIKFIQTKKTKVKYDEKTKKDKQVKIDLYKGTTLEEVISFLEEHGTDEDRKKFFDNCHLETKKIGSGTYYQKGKHEGEEIMVKELDENGNEILVKTEKLNWLYAKQKFFEEYAPEFLPVKKAPRKKVSSRMANWG